jgi:hypothetical protein
MIPPAPKFNDTNDLKNILGKIPNLGFGFLSPDKNIYTHNLLLLGILNRTYEIIDSSIWAIDNNRPQTAINMLRALIETLGFTYYAREQIRLAENENIYDKITALFFGSRKVDAKFKSVNIITCIDKAIKMFPQLRQVYDDACEVVHPNSKSLSHFGKATGDNGEVTFKIPFYEFKDGDKEKIINQTGECCHYIQALCFEMSAYLK